MFVLSRTVWAKNSLLITVIDEMFSLVKTSGKLLACVAGGIVSVREKKL